MKKVKIIIIALIIVLILAGGVFAVIYFATDTFKSNQELFNKYISQIDLTEIFDAESYSNYITRTQTEAHSNNGELSINITQGEETISEAITYTGYSDPTNQKSSSQITIDKDEETLLTMNYLKNGDMYGIQFVDIVNQYIVVENSNLKEFATKLGITDADSILDEIESSDISYEEINSILNDYINVAISQIPEENYSKIEETTVTLGSTQVSADGYQLTLSMDDMENIIDEILSENDIIYFEEVGDTLVDSNSQADMDFMTISVYKQGKDTIKLEVSILPESTTSSFNISLDYASSGLILKATYVDNELGQEISFEATKTVNTEEQEIVNINIVTKENNEETGNYNITINRTGALTSSNVTNSISFTTSIEGIDVSIGFTETKDFSTSEEIEDYIEGNYLIINDLEQEQLNNLITNLGNLLSEALQDELIMNLLSDTSSIYSLAQQATEEYQDALDETEETEATEETQEVQEDTLEESDLSSTTVDEQTETSE